MTHRTRRLWLPSALVLILVLISAGRLSAPDHAVALFDPNGPAFDALSTFDVSDTPVEVRQPPRLLAGTNSHALPASAATRNGYCVDANIDAVLPVANFQVPASNLGFRITATDPIDPLAPPSVEVALPASGTYVSGPLLGAGAASINTGVGSTADDVYCVVAFAPSGYKNLHIEWHYQVGGGGEQTLALPAIPIVTVKLKKVGDGLVGGPAEVCTVGWDSTFLTGATTNVNSANPDPLNDVGPLVPGAPFPDFVLSGAPFAGTVTISYVRPVGPEWCAGVASSAAETNVGLTLNLHAVYNRVDIGARSRNADDQPASISLPPDQLITIAASIELRHVTMDGQVPPRQESEPTVIGSIHYVCLIGTDINDTLAVNGIAFLPLQPPQAPTASSINIFHKSVTDNPRLKGVANDTLCFSYTSTEPGAQTIFVNYSDNNVPSHASFDTNGDGNGLGLSPGGPLITVWNKIDATAITTGGKPTENVVTFGSIEIPLQFNVADGTYLAESSLTEWVLGSHTTNGKLITGQLLDGALLRLELVGGCGYFVVPDSALPILPARPKVVTGISIGGRFELNDFTGDPYGNSNNSAYGDVDAAPDDIHVSTLNSGGCGANATIRVQIDVYYPGLTAAPAAPQEWVDLRFSFLPSLKTPRVAWAGEYVSLTYAVTSNDPGSCASKRIEFIRPKGQPGTFIADGGVTLDGPGRAVANFAGCTATVRYESEDPGEVDVEIFIDGNNFSKISIPIFFLAFEDATIEATPDQFVSSFGDVTASIRGYFPGSNPSGRPSEVKADGRNVPKDRWILPTDWELLQGQSNLRGNWGSLEMPEAIVTFFMQNEALMNNYKAGVKDGGAGFFIPDDITDFSFNVNPHTRATTALGSVRKPRMMSQPLDDDGTASVDTFGDMNLSYEGCTPNRINRNPHCKPEDITGKTRYFVVAEYPQAGNRGKFPAIASNVAETVWRWAGYKDVTIVNTDSPQIKYVVAHLRDRDGFCDAANYNNTLGVLVKFEIDAGGGTIIDAADRPFTINGTRRFATATTFDTEDALGRPINTGIARPTLFPDQTDECQAWIKVTNSLLQPTNVMVTFPAPPSPIPGDIRITNLQCQGQETITVKNFGPNVVNLGGFALKSIGTDVGNAEELDLIGVLAPGESATFSGGPGADSSVGWIGSGSEVFGGPSDFASLVWEDFAINTVFCDGTSFLQAIPAAFPLDGEGEIIIDVVIPFGNEVDTLLNAGWNLVPTGKGTMSIAAAFAGNEDKVTAVYAWDAVLGEWTHYIAGAPAGVNTIENIGNGVILWVLVKQPFTLTLPK